jgi:hypothetical protein
MAKKTFNIQVTMEERWVDYFCSFLSYMQACGNWGHSAELSFFADGDGDFRPKFEFDIDYEKKDGIPHHLILGTPEFMWDAG